MGKKGINIHIYPSPISNETRMFKEARALKAEGFFDRIDLIGIMRGDLPDHEVLEDGIHIHRIRLSKYKKWPVLKSTMMWREWYKVIKKMYAGQQISVIQSHSLNDLPVAAKLKKQFSARLIYDSHEFSTEETQLVGWRKKVAKWKERHFIKKADHTFTVSPSICKWYSENYPDSKISLLRNLPDRTKETNTPGVINLREQFNINDGILFLYQGNLKTGRGVDWIIEIFEQLPPNKHIVFMGYGDLEDWVREKAASHANIHFQPAVAPDEVLGVTKTADVGLCILDNNSLNHYYCLPNKFFEYICAGIASLYSDFPDMNQMMENHQCGWPLPEKMEDRKALISQITPEQVAVRKEKARETNHLINWNEEVKEYICVYRELLEE